MRAARDQREQAVLLPVVAPLRRELQAFGVRNNDLQRSIDALSRVVTNSIVPHVYADIRDRIGQRVQQHVIDAMAQARVPVDDIITIALSAAEVRFCRPDEVTRQILDKASRRYLSEARGVGIMDVAMSVTKLQVVFPETTIEVVVRDEPSQRRRA